LCIFSNAAVKQPSAEDVPSQFDEVEVIASSKSQKHKASSQTAQSGKAATKKATKKTKQNVKSAPAVVDDPDVVTKAT